MFGHPSDEENPRLYWGARAIFRSGSIDLLWDRCTRGEQNDTQPDKHRFMRWVDEWALPRLRKWARNKSVNSEEVFTLCEDGCPYKMVASPRASHGYMYIGAWARSAIYGPKIGGAYGIKKDPVYLRQSDEHPNCSVVLLGGAEVLWSNSIVPQIGDHVRTLGMRLDWKGVIGSWFIQDGYAGVEVIPTHMHLDDCHRQKWCHINPLVFGREILIKRKKTKAIAA